MKSKKVLTILLSIAIMFTFMPATAFAAVAETDVVSVTTTDTTEAIGYASLNEALSATDTAANVGKNPVIKLLADVELESEYEVKNPLTIDLNGFELTETKKFDPNKGEWGGNDYGICRKDTESSIVFAEHGLTGETIYNWAKRENNDAWHVVGIEAVCDNCGFNEIPATPELTQNNPREAGYQTTPATPNPTGDTTYTFRERYRSGYYGNSYAWRTLDTKTVAGPEPDKYELTGRTQIVVVNGINQHEDGLPVVKTEVQDSVGNVVDADVTVTAATKDELDAVGVVVYAENGRTTVTTKPYNTEPTCMDMGKTTYKVVVADPDGKVLETKYLQDSQAAKKTDHVKGALKGYKLLERSVDFNSEADAIEGGKNNGIVKVTSTTTPAGTKYFYWAYGNLVEIEGTKTGNTIKDVTLAAKNLEDDGSFTIMPVYFCNFEDVNEVDGDEETVKPLADATTAAEAADGKHSKCEKWAYASKSITYTFGTEAVQSTFTSKLNFKETNKASKYFSHVSDGTKYDVNPQPTCEKEGTAKIKCAICGEDNVEVAVPKRADTFGAWTPSRPGQTLPDIGDFVIDETPLSGEKHVITLNSDKTEAVVAPTCTQPGGTFKWCTGVNNHNNGHWVLQGDATPATGHNLTTVSIGQWATGEDAPDYDAKKQDYYYTGYMMCSNSACDASGFIDGLCQVTFHSMKGKDTFTDKYDAIDIVKEEKGKDCATEATTTYTVKDIKDRTGAAITTKVEGDASTRGDHVLEVKNFNWSADFEAATVTTKCTFENCPDKNKTFTKEAKVTKTTDETGLTTYTASYGGELGAKTESKKVYTLKGAEVTYDTSEITDGNLVEGVPGAAAKTPKVTVTLNGTVIDNSELEEVWDYNANTSTVTLYVTWAADKEFDDDATRMTGNDNTRAYAENFHVAAKSRFSAPTTVVKENDKAVPRTPVNRAYDPTLANSVETSTTVKGATVKYACVAEEVTDPEEIDALDYNLDSVEGIKAVGTYYVYAQLSAEGYTTYSAHVATITINKASVNATIDNFTMRQGETPSFSVVFTDSNNKVVSVDPSEYTVTSVGGQALEDLLPGEYRLAVASENYVVNTIFTEGRVGTVSVLTKEGKTPAQDAADAAKAADLALADANAVVEKDYTAESYAKVVEAEKALKNAIATGSTEDLKAATAALNDAINALVPMKANTMTVKAKTVKAKTNKSTAVKKAKAFTVKKAVGKVTFKKTKGNKKIVVKSNGNVVVKKGLKKGTYKVKVNVKAAGNAEYKAKTKAVTLKVKVK